VYCLDMDVAAKQDQRKPCEFCGSTRSVKVYWTAIHGRVICKDAGACLRRQ